MTLSVSAHGFADLNWRLRQLGYDVSTKIGQSANRAGATVIAKAIKDQAPVGPDAQGSIRNRKRKSGKVVQEEHQKIANNIRVKKVRAPDGQVVNAVTAGQAYHATFVELGSIHNAPNPFFRRGFESSQADALDKIAQTLDRRLKKAGV